MSSAETVAADCRCVAGSLRIADCGGTADAGTVAIAAGVVISAVVAAVMEMPAGFGTALNGADRICAGDSAGTVAVAAGMVISAVIAAVMEMPAGFGTALNGADRVCTGNCRGSGVCIGSGCGSGICIGISGVPCVWAGSGCDFGVGRETGAGVYVSVTGGAGIIIAAGSGL